ncbi:hypothetical protein [Streptomyces sp. NPDC003077]|uniref:hypothetical protein n=1 Tax=Streptomyces sp. NPDC003077 TaxID=3154443 RepID=UPI0033A26F7F
MITEDVITDDVIEECQSPHAQYAITVHKITACAFRERPIDYPIGDYRPVSV